VERAKRSGGLHKRSAEDWGNGLRARGAELPLGGLAVVFRVGVAGRNRPTEEGHERRTAAAMREEAVLPERIELNVKLERKTRLTVERS
jgi:hypothetical protein